MADSLLQDPVVQAAVSKLQLRSERQENVEQLVETFVDPGVSVQLLNENNQILYGRRGTGKTRELKVVQRTVQQRADELAVYVDMRTLGSNSVFSDEGRPVHVRVAELDARAAGKVT
jgi:Cdc6-like AAA superfamily ATPase